MLSALLRRLRAAALLSLFAVLTACATCERHPVVCSVAGALIVGGAAAALEAHHGGAERVVTPRMSPLRPDVPHCYQRPLPLDCRPVGGP